MNFFKSDNIFITVYKVLGPAYKYNHERLHL